MDKTFRKLKIFLGWLVLILITAPLSGMIYEKIQYPSPSFLASTGFWNYFFGIFISYISITILFCFLFIKKTRNKYILALILTLPMLLIDLWATDGPKLLLDIANIAIFLIIGQIIVAFWHKKQISK